MIWFFFLHRNEQKARYLLNVARDIAIPAHEFTIRKKSGNIEERVSSRIEIINETLAKRKSRPPQPTLSGGFVCSERKSRIV